MSKIRVNKKLILAGFLLVVATICYWIFLTSNAQLEELDISWWIEAIPTTIEFVFLGKFHKLLVATELSYKQVVYKFSIGVEVTLGGA